MEVRNHSRIFACLAAGGRFLGAFININHFVSSILVGIFDSQGCVEKLTIIKERDDRCDNQTFVKSLSEQSVSQMNRIPNKGR